MPRLLLALETATDVCSVAVLAEGVVAVEMSLHQARRHAEQLVPLVEAALAHGGYRAADLAGVAVSMGPGSYTGLRIGVSTAKGLCLATGALLLGVPSLEALASRVAPFAAPGDAVCAAFNSRRDEVYAAAYRVEAGGHLALLAAPAAVEAAAVEAWLPARPGALWLVGEGVARVAALPHARALEHLTPAAAAVGMLAWPRLLAGAGENVAAFEPFYLKDFVAKAKPNALSRAD